MVLFGNLTNIFQIFIKSIFIKTGYKPVRNLSKSKGYFICYFSSDYI